jgi:hypothetical protein
MGPRRFNRTASSCRVGDWAVGSVQVVDAGAGDLFSVPDTKRVGDCLQDEDLTTIAQNDLNGWPVAGHFWVRPRAWAVAALEGDWP